MLTDTDNGGEDDMLAKIEGRHQSAARGNALLLETVAAGLGDRAAAPQSGLEAEQDSARMPPEALVSARRSFLRPDVGRVRVQPGSLRRLGRHGEKREALRQWHLGTVAPVRPELLGA